MSGTWPDFTGAHFIDIVIRRNGKNEQHEGDFLKEVKCRDDVHNLLVAAVKRLLEGFEPMHKRLYEHSGFMNATQLGDRDWNRAALSEARAALKLAESQP